MCKPIGDCFTTGIDPSLYDACTDLVERIVNERRGMWRVSAGVTCAYFSSAQKRSVAVALKGEPFVLFDESPIDSSTA